MLSHGGMEVLFQILSPLIDHMIRIKNNFFEGGKFSFFVHISQIGGKSGIPIEYAKHFKIFILNSDESNCYFLKGIFQFNSVIQQF